MKYETNDAPIQDYELGFGPSPAEKLFARNQEYAGDLMGDCDAAQWVAPEWRVKMGLEAHEIERMERMDRERDMSIGDIMEDMKGLADKIKGYEK